MPSLIRGFTLVECVACVGIIAAVATLGVPAWGALVEGARVSGAMHRLTADLAIARGSAVRGNVPHVACAGSEATGCGDSGWEQGWIVFADRNGNRRADPGEIVSEAGPMPTLAITSTRRQVRYLPDGRSPHANLSFRICREGALRGEVVVNNTGRVRSRRLSGATACPGASP